MELFLWLMMLTGALVLTVGCMFLAQERRERALAVVVRGRRSANTR